MTIVHELSIDTIHYVPNSIKEAIVNNTPIEDKLHVIAVISNPCLYQKRYTLMKEFIKRMDMEEPNVILYVVEMIYDNQSFVITDKTNKRHLQLHTTHPLWHKENMINLGVKYLLPINWKAFAWIDSDLAFESTTWAMDTLKILHGAKDIVQLFSHCVDMNQTESAMTIFTSAGHQYCKSLQSLSSSLYCGSGSGKGIHFWHPGFAWAMTRTAYDKIGGLYEDAILGSGDNIMLYSLLGNGIKAINHKSTDDYKQSIVSFQQKIKYLRFGYTPGVIRHYFHGHKKNRKYMERWQILIKHHFSPLKHLQKDSYGILIPSSSFPTQLQQDIVHYFQQRNEDEE